MTIAEMKTILEDNTGDIGEYGCDDWTNVILDLLTVMELAIVWRDSGIADCEHPASRDLFHALHDFTK